MVTRKNNKIDYDGLSEVFKVLSNPTRLRILIGLRGNECNVNKIVETLELPQSTISQHLALLRNKRIVTVRKDGVRCCYKIENELVSRIVDYFII